MDGAGDGDGDISTDGLPALLTGLGAALNPRLLSAWTGSVEIDPPGVKKADPWVSDMTSKLLDA